jgi:Xaa-Pro aminopeptidase
LITDFRYSEEATEHFKEQNVEVLGGTTQQINDFLQQILNDSKVNTIGYEDTKLSCANLERLKELIHKEFVPCGKAIEQLRCVKDEYELEQIETAQKITDNAFSKILGYIKAGVSERDIKTELEYQMYVGGADDIAFETIVASGSNSSRPHHGVSLRKINSGEFIILDFGAKYKGYCSDMTRTVAVGKPNPEMIKIYEAVLKAQQISLNTIKAKAECKDVFNAAKAGLKEYGEYFLHGLGHGVGLEIHEGPTVNADSTEKFLKNSVVTVEPGVYIEKAYGVRIEDIVIVKENGIKNLTQSKKELIIL